MSEGEMIWRKLDGPGHEYARVSHEDAGWLLSGVSIFLHEQLPCRFDYTILCDTQWRTQAGLVTGRIGDRNIDIEVSIDFYRTWRLNGVACPDVSRSIDLDLNFSPSTNLLSIRRLNLSVGDQAMVMAAWLRFPEFTLEPLEQIYRRVDKDTYHYESGGGKFTAELKVNSAGFVTLYPKFWSAE
jgi:hypothetical protein